jgi:SUF system FeS cluster assembly, SufBD
MKYPSIYLLGERAHGEVLSIAFASAGQHQDAGAKIIHAAPNTTSNIFAKSISKDGGRSSYRGLLEIATGAHGSRSKVVSDALLLDEHSRSDTYPTIRISEDDVNVGHEATVEGRRRATFLPDVAPHPRGRGLEAHRQRLHRADHQTAPDGIRRRDEPPDRTANGELNRLVASRRRELELPVGRRSGISMAL